MFPKEMFAGVYFAGVYFPGTAGEEDDPIPPLPPSAGHGGIKGVLNRVIGGRLTKVGRSGF